ncbi:hypothetical protein T02_14282 [Trichinella nativa]|uniref:Uncharacterized protein n=1 Tax=Trichinella nativa TaxID=6335 RepID=A0A0V1LS36_9BILA|nr:hypothetical protein T02_14282 [Trichinella nativa]
MVRADILLYKVMSACMKCMLVFLSLFFAFLCPPLWINKSSTICNDDAGSAAGLSVRPSVCLSVCLLSACTKKAADRVEFCSCLIRLASSLFSDEIFTYASKHKMEFSMQGNLIPESICNASQLEHKLPLFASEDDATLISNMYYYEKLQEGNLHEENNTTGVGFAMKTTTYCFVD